MSRKRLQDHSILVNKLSKQRNWLRKYGLRSVDFTKNIGDCLFDNIVVQFPGRVLKSSTLPPIAVELRGDLIEYMGKNAEVYFKQLNGGELRLKGDEDPLPFKDWREYLEHMGTPGVWGTEREIRALAFFLQYPIVLLTDGRPPKIYNLESEKPPFFLHDLKENHFESCVPINPLGIKEVYDLIRRGL